MPDVSQAQIATWPGSGSIVSGNTDFGYYDNDAQFQNDAPRMATWCAKQLGYPIMDVEMTDVMFYNCLEDAVTEYSSQVNQFNIRENIMDLQGSPNSQNLTHRRIDTGIHRVIELSKAYGTEAGSGGNVDWKKGYVTVSASQQEYNLNVLWANVSESGNRIEIKRVFHNAPPPVARYSDSFGLGGVIDLRQEFGHEYVLTPAHYDVLRMQAIELNDLIRRSGYTFELINNKLRIYPIPTTTQRVWFDYIVENDRSSAVTGSSATTSSVSDYSNANYENMVYSNINAVGKQWIKRYTLASSKIVCGGIRRKYASIPIPNSEISLDGSDLISDGQQEREKLIEELRENLEMSSRKSQLETKAEESDNLQRLLGKAPPPRTIWIG